MIGVYFSHARFVHDIKWQSFANPFSQMCTSNLYHMVIIGLPSLAYLSRNPNCQKDDKCQGRGQGEQSCGGVLTTPNFLIKGVSCVISCKGIFESSWFGLHWLNEFVHMHLTKVCLLPFSKKFGSSLNLKATTLGEKTLNVFVRWPPYIREYPS